MAQNIRITITPDLERALQILRQSTLGTLNTTELIKMAVGSLAQIKKMKEGERIPFKCPSQKPAKKLKSRDFILQKKKSLSEIFPKA